MVELRSVQTMRLVKAGVKHIKKRVHGWGRTVAVDKKSRVGREAEIEEGYSKEAEIFISIQISAPNHQC